MPRTDPGTRAEHEAGLARFVQARGRARFRESLANPKMREKLRRGLYHHDVHLDPDRAEQLVTPHAGAVYERLIAAGAPRECFTFTVDGDGDEIPLRSAVQELMISGAGFISCVPGRLGLFVSEDGSGVYLLSAP